MGSSSAGESVAIEAAVWDAPMIDAAPQQSGSGVGVGPGEAAVPPGANVDPGASTGINPVAAANELDIARSMGTLTVYDPPAADQNPPIPELPDSQVPTVEQRKI